MTAGEDRDPVGHRVTVLDRPRRAFCGCGWSYDDPSPAGVRRAVLAHLGGPRPEPRACHSVCLGADFCLVEDGRYGDE